MEEIWKDIKEYEGLYQVSNFGNVKSLKKSWNTRPHIKLASEERILKQGFNTGRYYQVVLCKNSTMKCRKVHRLVALAFIPNANNKNEVNHLNGVKTDNRVENLEWATTKENIHHAIANNLRNYVKRGANGLAKLVLDENTGVYYDCLRDASDARGFNYGTLRNKMSNCSNNNTSLKYV